MAVEIEKKFILSAKETTKLKNNSNYSVIGIIQWYLDGAKDQMRTERIRMILSKDGNQKWILGKKECINGNLIHRAEEENIIEASTVRLNTLGKYQFIIKTRTILNTPFEAEVVLDRLINNPYLSYDTQHLFEIELKNEADDIDQIVQQVLSYFKIEELKDVSTDFNYTNQALAIRAKKKNTKFEYPILLDILKKEMRSDLDEKN